MPKPPQPNLFAPSLDGFAPLNGDGPRLWVRRLVIWSTPGEAPIRDIGLRPGLNIVWSPDVDAENGHMGHGGGKSSFCRLIRYCLGEDSYGTDAQRQRIADAMPDAHVGAEVVLDGNQWTVIRPIGAGSGSGAHCAVKGGSLDTLIQSELPNSTMGPLRQAIATAVMPSAAPQMPVGSSLDQAWEAALAWLTRDQECRLLDILDWRASETQSRSPSRNMSKPDRLRVVRLLVKALQQDEIDATRRAQEHKLRADEAARRKQRVEQVRDDVARNLNEMFGDDDPAPSPTLWTTKARSAESAAKHRADPQMHQKLRDARLLVEETEVAFRALDKRLTEIDAALPVVTDTLRMLDDRVPRASEDIRDALDPRCPTCGQTVPPEAQTFIHEQQAMLDGLREEQTKVAAQRTSLQNEQGVVKGDAALAGQQLNRARAALEKQEQIAKAAADAMASATGYVTLTTRYPSYLTEISRLDAEWRRELEGEIAEQRAAAESRQAAQGVVQRLSELFHFVIQMLVPEGAEGQVVLNERGIHPVIGLHGDLSTAAIESLKVVAFDIAALMLTMEGKTELPGFWLHDSPREADLGLAIYHRLFELARWLEDQTDTPQFQYIITTTTAPPIALRGEPWRVLELSSAPTPSRLFQRDL